MQFVESDLFGLTDKHNDAILKTRSKTIA